MLRRVWIWTLIAVLMCIGDSYGATVSAPALQVVSCYGASDYDGAGIMIDFRNHSSVAYRTVVWRVSFGGHGFDFISTAHSVPNSEVAIIDELMGLSVSPRSSGTKLRAVSRCAATLRYHLSYGSDPGAHA